MNQLEFMKRVIGDRPVLMTKVPDQEEMDQLNFSSRVIEGIEKLVEGRIPIFVEFREHDYEADCVDVAWTCPSEDSLSCPDGYWLLTRTVFAFKIAPTGEGEI